MKKIYKLILAVALLCSATWQVAAQAVVAPPTDGSYFYIQFTRGTNLVVENEGSGTKNSDGTIVAGTNQLKSADLVFGKAAQLWRADSDGAGGYFFVSKALDTADGVTELQISWDAEAGRFIAAPYDGSTVLYTITTGITPNAAYLPACDIVLNLSATNGLNPWGGSSIGNALAVFSITDDGTAVRFVPESSTNILLHSYLIQANGILSGASLNPGNHSAEVLATFKVATASVQAVYDNVNSTVDEIVVAGNTLRNAVLAYNAAPYTILPAISSADASNEKWYFFQGTRPTNSYMTSMGAAANVYSKTVIPDETQMWKIVNNTNPAGTMNGYVLVNKKTGEYLNTDLPSNTGLNTTPVMPAMNVVFNISTLMTNGVARFWIENAGSTSASTDGFTFRLHAGESQVLDWTGNRFDNSSWLLMDYSISLKTFLKDAITAANLVVNNITIPVGTALGQYPANAQTNLATAVTTAQAVVDNASASDVDVKAAIANLNAAVIICEGRRSDAVISTAASPRWFVIRNLYRTDINGVQNHVITSNGVIENGGLICESQANANEQLWRFESNATGGVKIINAAQPTLGMQDAGNVNTQQKLVAVDNASGYIIDILGTGYKLTSIQSNGVPLHENAAGVLLTFPEAVGNASNWSIEERTSPASLFLPQTITFDAIPAKVITDAPFDLTATTDVLGGSVTYTSSNAAVAIIENSTVTIIGAGNTVITASNPGDATYASASVQQTFIVNLTAGVQDVTDGISVVVKNRIIVVTGTNAPVRAFTVTGAEVDAKKALAQGIYIVKVAGKTVKVDVR
jgi:hypothetical protein